MNYKKPNRLPPLQLHCPHLTYNNSRLISRDEARINGRLVIKNVKSIDTFVKSFPRMYYQQAVRSSSFHQSYITGKTRVARKYDLSHLEIGEKRNSIKGDMGKIILQEKKVARRSERIQGNNL